MSELLDQIEARHAEISKHAGLGKSQRRMLDAMFESVKDVPRLLAAIRAVEAVHQKRGASWPHNGGVFVCGADGAIWPCPTIRALIDALEGER